MKVTHPESLIFWSIIVFIILFVLLRKYAWKPILGAVKSREASINKALDTAEEARKELQNLQADNEKLLKEARAERDAMIKEAREIKDKMITDAKGQAQVEADKMIQQARQSIDSEKQAALADLKNQVASLSVEIAEKVIKRELSSNDRQLKLVDDMLDEVTLN
ncbi:F0F1 ATP synthase subunit B [Galbibacter sp. EGI 63066]|uniref:F0F1 ATP synthase subunit B n=1 Tax=Galbibacter sp. EGI 63066 TaxID=2993559 RepID=UPI002248FBC1|nr:F0F1 ATP synthase subunit B [Galbibacter sp. EGI 63066]MCX2681187.1 F0F1 ATP synthase subunit B [Galbibacter sp. EGI 63066]